MYRLTGKGIYPPPVGFSVDIDGTMRYFDAQAQEVDMDGARVPSTRSWGIPTFTINTDPYHKAILTRTVFNTNPNNRVRITVTSEEWIISGCTRENVAKCIFDMLASPRSMLGATYTNSSSTTNCAQYVKTTFAKFALNFADIYSFFAHMRKHGILHALCEAFPAHGSNPAKQKSYTFDDIVTSLADTEMARSVYVFIMYSIFGPNNTDAVSTAYINLRIDIHNLNIDIETKHTNTAAQQNAFTTIKTDYTNMLADLPNNDTTNADLAAIDKKIKAPPLTPSPTLAPTSSAHTAQITEILGSLVSYANFPTTNAIRKNKMLQDIKDKLATYIGSVNDDDLKDDADNIFEVFEYSKLANIHNVFKALEVKCDDVPDVKLQLQELTQKKADKTTAETDIKKLQNDSNRLSLQLTTQQTELTNATTEEQQADAALTAASSAEEAINTQVQQLQAARNTAGSDLSQATTAKEGATLDYDTAKDALLAITTTIKEKTAAKTSAETQLADYKAKKVVKDAQSAEETFNNAATELKEKRAELKEAQQKNSPNAANIQTDVNALEIAEQAAKTSLDNANLAAKAEIAVIEHINEKLTNIETELNSLNKPGPEKTKNDLFAKLEQITLDYNNKNTTYTEAKDKFDKAQQERINAQSEVANAQKRKVKAIADKTTCETNFKNTQKEYDTVKADLQTKQAEYDKTYVAGNQWIQADISDMKKMVTMVKLRGDTGHGDQVKKVDTTLFAIDGRKKARLDPTNYLMRSDTTLTAHNAANKTA